MKRTLLLTAQAVFLFCALILSNKISATMAVRVLLAECTNPATVQWNFKSEEAFVLSEPRADSPHIQMPTKELNVTCKDDYFYLNDKKCLKKTCVLSPLSGHINFNGTEYHGKFLLACNDRGSWLINIIDLEEYVYSVLRSEGWPGWPLEMNKVQAIAVRTYVIAMVKEAKENKRLYHVKNTNYHQVYRGLVQNSPDLRKAVEATQGQFLSYENKPIIAMFDICCGGVIPAGMCGIDFKKAPYLARDYVCKYCKGCKSYSWTVSFDKQIILEKFRQEFPELHTVRDIKVSKKDKAGLVQEVIIKGGQALALTGKKVYSLFKEVKSFCFSVYKKGNTITFKGNGHGHHLGLCQWGAREMVRDGWDHKKILSFYYPKTMLMRVV